jgi:hypothetical protein
VNDVCLGARFREADKLLCFEDHKELRLHFEDIVRTQSPGHTNKASHIDITPIQRRLIDANIRRRNRFLDFQNRSQLFKMRTPRFDYLENTSLKSTLQTVKGFELDIVSVSHGGDSSSSNGFSNAKTPGVKKEQKETTGLAAESVYPKAPQVYGEFQSFECPSCFALLPSAYQEETLWQ